MKGLFLNGFYSAVGNMKLFLFVVAAAAAAFLLTGSPTAQELFVYITITALPVNAVVGMRKDAASRWSRYELTMPVRRRDILRCKYVSYLLWVLAGVALSLLVTAIAGLFHTLSGNFSSMFLLGAGIAILAGALYYLLAHLFGAEKSETILFISVLGAIGLAILFLNMLHRLHLPSSVNAALFVAFYTICFLLSYLAASAVYRRKEY